MAQVSFLHRSCSFRRCRCRRSRRRSTGRRRRRRGRLAPPSPGHGHELPPNGHGDLQGLGRKDLEQLVVISAAKHQHRKVMMPQHEDES